MANEIVLLLYGAQWLGMIPVLQVIAAATGFGIGASTTAAIFNAKNRVDLSLKIYLVNTVLNVGMILVASRWGMMGIAYAKLVLSVLNLIFFRIALGLLGMRTRDLMHIVLMPTLAAAAMLSLIMIMIMIARPWVY